jgi:pimeloyl-ACP methyl ester carboxylesterase
MVRTVRTRTIDVAGTRLAVHEWGEEGAPALLFWHALGDHTGLQMAEAAPILAGRFGLRVTALDAPGFGASPPIEDPERLALRSVAPLALAAADALGLDRPVLVGSSWGAAVALAAAALAPERLRGLVLIDSGYQPSPGSDESLDELRAHWRAQEGFRHLSWEAWRADARAYFGRFTPELERALRPGFREEDGEVVSVMGPDLYATVIWALRSDPSANYLDRVAASDLSVLLLVATEPPDPDGERAREVATFADRLPRSRVVHVEGAHHHMLEDAPEQVADAIGRWAGPLYA